MDENTIIKFYYSWQRPYAQRAWITLNHLNIKYELIESFTMDDGKTGYVKNANLLKVNPKGTIPTLDVNGEIIVESINIIEYLHKYTGNQHVDPNFLNEELKQDTNTMNQNIGSTFFDMFFKEEVAERDETWKKFTAGLKTFSEHIQPNGFFKSATMNVVDITVFPMVIRLCIIETFRHKSLDKSLLWVEKLMEWRTRMLSNKAVSDTVADEDKLLEGWQDLMIKMGEKT